MRQIALGRYGYNHHMNGVAVLLSCIIVMLCGCACHPPADESLVTLPDRELPTGWTMMPSSEMPPIDKTPWWKKNPQFIRGTEIRRFEILPEGAAESVCSMWTAMYAKGEDRIMLSCFAYPTLESAADALGRLQEEDAVGPGTSVQLSLNDRKTIVLMSIPADCPSRQFFLDHFKSITAGSSVTDRP